MGELVGQQPQTAVDAATVEQIQGNLLESIERDDAGRPQLRVTLADDTALADLARNLAQLLVAGKGP